VWPMLLLLVLLQTVADFELMIHYQQRVTPTRAALVYMFEPVFATIFAWLAVARVHDPIVLIGAGLILIANVLAEVLGMRRPSREG
jgi:drug/metabolite transporter (DMT)-like permease